MTVSRPSVAVLLPCFNAEAVVAQTIAGFPAALPGARTCVYALELRMPWAEVETTYFVRPEGSTSKLSTYGDGWRILSTIVTLYRLERPLLFIGMIAILLVFLGLALAAPLAITYAATGLVPRFPTAILVMGLVIVAALSFFAGLILDTVVRGQREMRRLANLSFPAPKV